MSCRYYCRSISPYKLWHDKWVYLSEFISPCSTKHLLSVVRYHDHTNLQSLWSYCLIFSVFQISKTSLWPFALHHVMHDGSMLCIVLVQCYIILQLWWCFSASLLLFWLETCECWWYNNAHLTILSLPLPTWAKANIPFTYSLDTYLHSYQMNRWADIKRSNDVLPLALKHWWCWPFILIRMREWKIANL